MQHKNTFVAHMHVEGLELIKPVNPFAKFGSK